MNKQQGISLVELMISLLLSSLLISLLMKHYLISKQQYHQSQMVLEANYEWQLVSSLIRDSIRHAGFTPCIGINHLIIKDRRSFQSTQLKAVRITADNHLMISRMSNHFSEAQLSDSYHLLVDNSVDLPSKASLLIADCLHAEIHSLSRVYSTPKGMMLVLEKPLLFDYVAPLYVGEWMEEHFFIANKALYYANPHPEQLSSLITTMSLQKKGALVRVILGSVNQF